MKHKHTWLRSHEIDGGCRENPGVFSRVGMGATSPGKSVLESERKGATMTFIVHAIGDPIGDYQLYERMEWRKWGGGDKRFVAVNLGVAWDNHQFARRLDAVRYMARRARGMQ